VNGRDGLLRISELAERSGVSPGTIKHYLREGLLPEPVKTSRNMSWYPPEFVDRVRLIKRLQEDRFLPLKVIRDVLQALDDREGARVPREAVRGRLPDDVLDRLADIGVLTPAADGYDPDDVAIIDAIVRFRAGGYDESLGFTVYDTLRYQQALAPLVREEVSVLLDRLASDGGVERAAELIATGADPLRELIGAVHSKLMLAELRRAASARRRPPAAPPG